MGRRATLKPALLKIGKWYVSIPPELSENGDRTRRYFETKALASAFCEELKARRDNMTRSMGTLTPAQMVDATGAFQLLSDRPDLTLSAIVSQYLALEKSKLSSVRFLDLFSQFIQTKSERNPAYLKELTWIRDRFPQLHDQLACDITAFELDGILNPLSAGARNPIMRYWRAVFNYGIKRGYLTENPIRRMDFASRPRKEIQVIPTGSVRSMLGHALENDLKLLPYLTLGFLCGIRPEGELPELEWRDVDLDDRVVTIRPEVSKTNRRRFVDLSENAVAWLNSYGERGGTFTGRVLAYDSSELRTRRTANWKAAGLTRWVQQGMRHTFCSAWLNLHRDINKLVLMSGHDSVDTMWRNYFKGMTEAEAKDFWAILPPTADEKKIVQFQAAAGR
jgi:integrase